MEGFSGWKGPQEGLGKLSALSARSVLNSDQAAQCFVQVDAEIPQGKGWNVVLAALSYILPCWSTGVPHAVVDDHILASVLCSSAEPGCLLGLELHGCRRATATSRLRVLHPLHPPCAASLAFAQCSISAVVYSVLRKNELC